MGFLKVGDTIQCKDADDAAEYMTALAKDNIDTDFLFEKDGQQGLWLIVKNIGEAGK